MTTPWRRLHKARLQDIKEHDLRPNLIRLTNGPQEFRSCQPSRGISRSNCGLIRMGIELPNMKMLGIC